MTETLTIVITSPAAIADVKWRLAHPEFPLNVVIEGIGYTPDSATVTDVRDGYRHE
jgi:hypothetical protein